MFRYMASVEYRGAGFHGFQKQPDVPTIQGALEDALLTFAGEPVRVVGSGRTDAGVNAVGQTIAFDLGERVEERACCRSLTALLPSGIAVTGMMEVQGGFDPRRDAAWREYRYFVLNRMSASPLMEEYVLHHRGYLDFELMSEACGLVEGKHDFSSFTAKGSEGPTTRDVLLCRLHDLVSVPGLFFLRVRAGSFLYKMVRIIAGAVLATGSGDMNPGELKRRLTGGDDGPCADPLPPHALFLWRVEYPLEKLKL